MARDASLKQDTERDFRGEGETVAVVFSLAFLSLASFDGAVILAASSVTLARPSLVLILDR